jgi:hypothetical protein
LLRSKSKKKKKTNNIILYILTKLEFLNVLIDNQIQFIHFLTRYTRIKEKKGVITHYLQKIFLDAMNYNFN